ncbi:MULTISPECIES: hypothetical protein [Glycomyces]|uniref:Uncharacterized protein n=2 Tax=Glycomyces TaxID=58113 RepID=A0A9X3SV75_9ACTN|nr:hypothetical protein [Glycomyces lechevalierae]MDA1386355.1 hypothetical protein [Glycomyces lechevalierae]MDR7338870.1 hypothetical protein [Glycomyces lechevalierae]
MTLKVTLSMAPDVATQLATELDRHRSHLDEAADVIPHDEAERLRARVAFLAAAIDTINSQLNP